MVPGPVHPRQLSARMGSLPMHYLYCSTALVLYLATTYLDPTDMVYAYTSSKPVQDLYQYLATTTSYAYPVAGVVPR